MYNPRLILPGLILFAVLATSPFWLNAGKGYERPVPQLPDPALAVECVEPREFMASAHMELLSAWRDAATRENRRTYTSSSGREWPISLTGTCLSCHRNKEAFCDTCHNAVAVNPYCWDCHIVPEKQP